MIKYTVYDIFSNHICYAFRINHDTQANRYLKEKYGFGVTYWNIGKFLVIKEETNERIVIDDNSFNARYIILDQEPIYPAVPLIRQIEKLYTRGSEDVYDWIRNKFNIVSPSKDLLDWAYGSTSSLATDPSDDRMMKLVAEELRDIYGVKTDRVVQACSESDPIQKITADDVAKLLKELVKEKLDKAVQNIKLDVPSLYPNICRSPSINMCNWLYGWPTPCHLDIRDMADMRKEKTKEKTTMKTSITLDIKKVIFNDPATIVIWADGTKTVVKCREGETYSKWAGLALCYSKRICGDKFHSEFKRWCGEDEEEKKENKKHVSESFNLADSVNLFTDSIANASKRANECFNTLAEAFNKGVKSGIDKTSNDKFVFHNVYFGLPYDHANSLLQNLRRLTIEKGYATVADFYEAAGVPDNNIDSSIYEYGWKDLSTVGIRYLSANPFDWYYIAFPDPKKIK